MIGMDRRTGAPIGEAAHLAQSITDILSTPVGSRVLRRAYGSDLPNLIDAPINGETVVDVYQAVAEALDRWEPRLLVERVRIAGAAAGRMLLEIEVATPGIVGPIEIAVEARA